MTSLSDDLPEQTTIDRLRKEKAWAEDIRCLIEAATEINQAMDLDFGLTQVAKRVKKQIDFDTFAVLLFDDVRKDLFFRYALGIADDITDNWRFGPGQGLAGTVANSGEAILVNQTADDPRLSPVVNRLQSVMCLPLVSKNRVIGVLDIGSHRPDSFSRDQMEMMGCLTSHLASAVENAQLYRNMKHQTRMLSLLHDISRQLTSILDRQQLLRRIAEMIKQLIDYDVFDLMIWNEEAQLLETDLTVFGDRPVAPFRSLALGQGVIGTAAAFRQAVRVPDVHVDPRFVECEVPADVHSELAVPLTFKDRLVGVVNLESVKFDAYSERDEQTLCTLAATIAIALENARLYEKLRQEEERLEEELTTAQEIQKSLLPKKPPQIDGLEVTVCFCPARQLGGDLYDFLPYGDGSTAIVVGDVAGKATPAALYASMTVGMLRSHVIQQQPCDPRVLLLGMNEQLRQLAVPQSFVALFFGVYNSSKRTLTMANAGFPDPFLVRKRIVRELPFEGIPLGRIADVHYRQKTIRLSPGDVFALCSDGFHECRDSQEEEFGSTRIREILRDRADRSSQEIACGLIEATDSFAVDSSNHGDDRTILVIKAIE